MRLLEIVLCLCKRLFVRLYIMPKSNCLCGWIIMNNYNNEPLHFAVQMWGSVGSRLTWKKLKKIFEKSEKHQCKIVEVLIWHFSFSVQPGKKSGCGFFFFFSNIVMWGQWFRQTLEFHKSHKSRRTPPHVHKQLRTLHPREEKQRDVKQANTINASPPRCCVAWCQRHPHFTWC